MKNGNKGTVQKTIMKSNYLYAVLICSTVNNRRSTLAQIINNTAHHYAHGI